MKHNSPDMPKAMFATALAQGSSEGVVEMQERLAQAEVTGGGKTSEVWFGLRIEPVSGKNILEKAGVVFLDVVEDPVQKVRLPEGWRLVPTEHDMWSNLEDAHGRVHATCFYKGAFYDRRAHVSLQPRYTYKSEYTEPHGESVRFHVMDGEKTVLWTSDWVPARGKDDSQRRAEALKGETWLDENYPEWRDLTAYW